MRKYSKIPVCESACAEEHSHLFDMGDAEHATERSPVPLNDSNHFACGLLGYLWHYALQLQRQRQEQKGHSFNGLEREYVFTSKNQKSAFIIASSRVPKTADK